MLSKFQQKLMAIVFCYMSDIALVAWMYFKATNYNRYTRMSGKVIDSPDFQFQFYQLMLQSLTFLFLLFLLAQTVVYILAWRNFRASYLYLKYFAVFGFAVSMFITFTSSFYAIPTMVIYVFGYYIFAKNYKELTAVLRNSSLSPTPQ